MGSCDGTSFDHNWIYYYCCHGRSDLEGRRRYFGRTGIHDNCSFNWSWIARAGRALLLLRTAKHVQLNPVAITSFGWGVAALVFGF